MTYIVCDNIFPRVTSILEETKPLADKERLRQYRENLDEQGKIELEQKKTDGARRGTNVHKCMEAWLSPILGVPRAEWETSLEQLKGNPWTAQYVTWIRKHANRFLDIECFVWSKKGYAGTLDCVVEETDGNLYIWDWKTSNKRKKKEWVTDYRHQVAAYGQAYKERTGKDIHGARILIAVNGGVRASNYKDEGFEYLENMTLFNERLKKYVERTGYTYF